MYVCVCVCVYIYIHIQWQRQYKLRLSAVIFRFTSLIICFKSARKAKSRVTEIIFPLRMLWILILSRSQNLSTNIQNMIKAVWKMINIRNIPYYVTHKMYYTFQKYILECISENCLANWKTGATLYISYKRKLTKLFLVCREIAPVADVHKWRETVIGGLLFARACSLKPEGE